MKYMSLNVIPTPKLVEGVESGGEFLSTVVQRGIYTSNEEFKCYINTFAEYVYRIHGVKIDFISGGIELSAVDGLKKGEYILKVENNVIKLYAHDADGATNALSTVLQLLKNNGDTILFPEVTIKDEPDCQYRALMVDLARQWHDFDILLEYVDLCYLYKIKYLHLHFIDTQSYTLPSDIFPQVSTKERHYTKEQIAQLNEYAYARNIELIPEFEVPGHSAAMVNAYPEVFANTPCDTANNAADPEAFKTEFNNNIICVGKVGILDNIKKLLCEIAEMFPHSHYIHIGGDEAEINDWSVCKYCIRYMKEHDINNVRELYTHFIKLTTDMVLDIGRTPVVWEGFPKEGSEAISRDILVVAWESLYHLPNELVDEGFNIVNASWKPVYITPKRYWSAEDIIKWDIYTWSNWWEKSKAYLNPIQLQPTSQVKGGMLCSWECNYDQEIEHIRENLAAVSQRTWNIQHFTDYTDFKNKLISVLEIAKKLERNLK